MTILNPKLYKIMLGLAATPFSLVFPLPLCLLLVGTVWAGIKCYKVKCKIDEEIAIKAAEKYLKEKYDEGEYNSVDIGLTTAKVEDVVEKDSETCVVINVNDMHLGLCSDYGTTLEKNQKLTLMV